MRKLQQKLVSIHTPAWGATGLTPELVSKIYESFIPLVSHLDLENLFDIKSNQFRYSNQNQNQNQQNQNQEQEQKSRNNLKYVCPHCGQIARAKKNANLICGACYDNNGTIVKMEVEVK